MFGIRTPAKKPSTSDSQGTPPDAMSEASPTEHTTTQTSVRGSIGECEASIGPSPKLMSAVPAMPKKAKATNATSSKTTCRKSTEAPGTSPGPSQKAKKPTTRTAQAKVWLQRAKACVNESRNLKTDLKQGILNAVDKLYQLVKEAEASKGVTPPVAQDKEKETEKETGKVGLTSIETESWKKALEEHSRLLNINTQKMDDLKEALQANKEQAERLSYADAVASRTVLHAPPKHRHQHAALHSVIVNSTNELETGEQVMEHIRKSVNAKEGWVTIDRIRKAKDRKIILGCRTEEEKEKVKQRLACVKELLNVEDMKNKDPLVVLKDVLITNTDEDIYKALKNQNRDVFHGLSKDEEKIEVLYKKRARNPHTHNVVLRVTPKIWTKLQEKGAVHIDLQRIRVEDQSPLVQCSLCLGYGHGRRLCSEKAEKCSHCGGPHVKANCTDWQAGTVPKCCNCVHEGLDRVEHNAFSAECPVRRKWDMLARSRVAYC